MGHCHFKLEGRRAQSTCNGMVNKDTSPAGWARPAGHAVFYYYHYYYMFLCSLVGPDKNLQCRSEPNYDLHVKLTLHGPQSMITLNTLRNELININKISCVREPITGSTNCSVSVPILIFSMFINNSDLTKLVGR